MDAEQLKDYHVGIVELTEKIFQAVDPVFVDGDYLLDDIIAAMILLCARLRVEYLRDESAGIVDHLVKDEEIDWALILRKAAISSIPERLSDEFKRETHRTDREIKRYRQMANAPEGGEA